MPEPVLYPDRTHSESGIDLTQLVENLRVTPTERLARMLKFLEFFEELKRARARRSVAP